MVTIAGSENANGHLALVNGLGQIVMQQGIEEGSLPRVRIPTSVSAGMYQLVITTGTTTERVKLVVW